MRTSLFVLFLFMGITVYAQRASIKRVEIAGEKIIVHYDLEDSSPGNEYQISLYSSQSNFATALTKVTGDVGPEIKPGANKKIEWDITEELGPYRGKIALEIRGKMFIPVAKFNINAGRKLKRGKNHEITWKPGNSNPVNIELLKGDQPINSQLNQPNDGSYSLLIGPQTMIGKDYRVRITDTRDAENVSTSQPFSVTRKVPMLLKVVPILAIGGVVAVLAGGGGGPDDPDDTTTGGEIPLPGFPSN